MSKTMKRVSALLLAILMIVTYMPMMQETAYAAKAKKPAKVKWAAGYPKISGTNKNQLALKWKKAKNAKKYVVSITHNGLTATKTTKKLTLTLKNCQYNSKYTVKVRGINGKKKGAFSVKKTKKFGADPKLTKAQKDLKEAQEEYDELKEDKDATDAQLEQAQQNLEVAAEQYDKLDAQAREQLKSATSLSLGTWNPEVKNAINAMITANAGQPDKYAVFDFDNTCSIFDVEEQLAVYQLQKMAFAVTPAELPDVLAEGLNEEYFVNPAPASKDYCDNPDATYQDWIDDIQAAYVKLVDKYGQFTAAGLDEAKQEEIQKDDDWKEFATKMRAMYDCVFDSESADVAYPWVLYWFTGMSHEEVYNLAKESHTKYKNVGSTEETWTTAGTGSKLGEVSYTWTSGTQVSQNIVELMASLKNAGIDVWVCSASATDPIRAAIDVFGLHDVVTGMMAMTNKYTGDKFDHKYDYETGYAWIPTPGNSTHAGWTEDNVATKAQTQGVGKSIAIQNVLGPKYHNAGPIAGFMDSTGDFNFCSEFKDLEVVCCFNRASRKTTDGGGLAAEIAVYEADELHYDYAAARAAGDTLYVLQGRQENGFRDLLNDESTKGRGTLTLGSSSVKVFRDKEDDDDNPEAGKYKGNTIQYTYIKDNHMSVKDAINKFAYKTKFADSGDYGYKYGFLKTYSGYHSKTGKFAETIGLKSWNPEVKYAINDMMAAEKDNDQYAVFDFDNTCSIFDVEEQLGIYQLQTMSFASDMTVAKLTEVLKTGIAEDPTDFPQGLDTPISADELEASYFTGTATYNDWISDITAAYQRLLDAGYEPKPEGYPLGTYDESNADWYEFATKMRAMYDLVFDSESADKAYPWILYWFTGMTEEEVYNLAKGSHSYYKELNTSEVTWVSPEKLGQKVNGVKYTWTSGTQVSENINELMKALDANGIDVWVCSASATDPIRAAIDVWGLHDYVTGMMAMTNKLVDKKYINEYDYNTGYAWFAKPNGEWEKDNVATQAQTQGVGKSIAISNVLYPKYNNHGPIAGFMDSTGDFNFCSEFETLQVVCCFNRASRKTTDGGGLIAEMAVYEADDLGYDYAKAQAAGDTLYVLQGRNEYGKRGLLPGRETKTFDADTKEEERSLKLWRDKEHDKDNPLSYEGDTLINYKGNTLQYNYIKAHEMTVKAALDRFSIKTKYNAEGNDYGYKYGFLKGTQAGYHGRP